MRKFFEEIDPIVDWEYSGYIVRQQLITTRGWTPQLIDRFLVPDLVEVNPHNHNQRMRLYLQNKVFEAEKNSEFQALFVDSYLDKLAPKERFWIQKMVNIRRRGMAKEERQRRWENHSQALRRINTSKTRITNDDEATLAEMGLL